MNHKEWLKGWLIGNLILMAALFVMQQWVFQSSQKVFTIGFVNGQWEDLPAQAPHAKMTMR
jgi:hypothetical protein